MNLKGYCGSGNYKEVFDYNFKNVDSIENCKIFRYLVSVLAKMTKINSSIIFLEIKKYIMDCQEYYPDRINIEEEKEDSLTFYLRNYYYLITHQFKNSKKIKDNEEKGASIIIDDFYSSSLSHFYGEDLVENLKKSKYNVLIKKWNRLVSVNIIILVKSFFGYVTSAYFILRIKKKHKIALKSFFLGFITSYFTGLTIKKKYRPKVIISGNDNGFDIIKAKSAQAEIVLIQNGLRGVLSDSSYKYSDYYFSITGNKGNLVREETGCNLGEIYSFGSIRLHHFLKGKDVVLETVKYDILYIDWGNLKDTDNIFSNYYDIREEYKIIKLLNQLAEKSNYKIAYHCRYEEEVTDLKELGLFSEKIVYLKNKDVKVYDAIIKSSVVLSSGSTVSVEAMALNKKVGFINFSGNVYLNYLFRDLNKELVECKIGSFVDYLEKVSSEEVDYSAYINQNANYILDFISVINKIMEN